MSKLFREKAVAAQSERLDGEVLLTRSRASWVVVWLAAILVALLVGYLFLASYAKSTAAQGVLVPSGGAIFITPPSSGTLTNIHVSEGQRVRANDVLFTLSDERHFVSHSFFQSGTDEKYGDHQRRSMLAEEASLVNKREQVKFLALRNEQALSAQLQAIKEQVKQTRALIERHEKRLHIAKEKYENHADLVRSGFFSKHALAEQEDSVTLLESQGFTHKRELLSLQGRSREIEDDLRTAPLKSNIEIANIDREIGALKQRIQEQDIQSRVNIVAPIDGVITGITAHIGQTTSNKPLAILLSDNAELEAHAYLNSRSAGFVQEGQKVKVRFDAFPYQKFGQYTGVINEISQNPIAPEALPASLKTPQAEDFYRAVIKLDSQYVKTYGEPKRLVAGMLFEATIRQDSRRIIEWIVEPLYALTKFE